MGDIYQTACYRSAQGNKNTDECVVIVLGTQVRLGKSLAIVCWNSVCNINQMFKFTNIYLDSMQGLTDLFPLQEYQEYWMMGSMPSNRNFIYYFLLWIVTASQLIKKNLAIQEIPRELFTIDWQKKRGETSMVESSNNNWLLLYYYQTRHKSFCPCDIEST